MKRVIDVACCLAIAMAIGWAALAKGEPAPTTGATDKLPHIHLDVAHRQVDVECEALNVDIPLEFVCVTAGGNEHESILRTHARPSDIHLALLAIGLKPGEPMHYDDATHKWFPPKGPPLQISVEYQRGGQRVRLPIHRLIRAVRGGQTAPPMTFIFDGSRLTDDGTYGADPTGYVVSLCNFDYTLIDVPELVSSANETLEWERDPSMVPATGTAVTMIIEPAEAGAPLHAAHASTGPMPTIVVLKIAAEGSMTLDGRAVPAGKLAERLAEIKKQSPAAVRIAAVPGTDPPLVESARQAVHDAGLKLEAASPATRPAENNPFGG